jgi:hypothetical protein
MREKILVKHRDSYFAILSKLLLFEEEDLSPEIFEFYINDAGLGIYQSSPITRTKCVSILSYFSRIRLDRVLTYIYPLK